MRTMLVSEFKAKCIAVLKEAQRSREPVLVTRRGVPLARIEPICDDPPKRQFGKMKGSMKILGEIVETNFDDDWEADWENLK